MKKSVYSILIITSFIFLCNDYSIAQQFSLGIKAGPLISWSTFGDRDDKELYTLKPKIGYSFAGVIVFPLKDNYTFQADLGLSRRGRKILFNEDTWKNSSVYYFADVSMLLRKSLRFDLGKNIPSEWYIGVGPKISYWIMGNGIVDAGGTYKYKIVFGQLPEAPPEPDFDKMYLHNINRYQFGIDFATGMIAPLKHGQKIQGEIRFTSGSTFFGTRNSASNRTLGFTDNLRSNEKVLTVTCTYYFNFDLMLNKMGKSNKDKEVKRKPVKRRK